MSLLTMQPQILRCPVSFTFFFFWGIGGISPNISFSGHFFRGFAYESLGYYKNAKKDYKVAKKHGVFEANAALERIKQKMKAKRQ